MTRGVGALLVVGLGNPGAKYAATRHNVGFRVVDALVARGRATAWCTRFSGEHCELTLAVGDVDVLKPMTYMNASGQSVARATAALGLRASQALVVHDELDLPFGSLRLKRGGGDGGHNGVRSVAAELGDPGFARLRLGVGRPDPEFSGDTAEFVLQAFAPTEQVELGNVLDRAADAVLQVLSGGLEAAMNVVNQRS